MASSFDVVSSVSWKATFDSPKPSSSRRTRAPAVRFSGCASMRVTVDGSKSKEKSEGESVPLSPMPMTGSDMRK